MRQLIAFTKKELYESHANFKAYILLAVFFFFGLFGPLMAMLTPWILEMIAAADSGIVITLPDPTGLDAWMQFFSNFSQMGMLALVILFAGTTAHELGRGTLVNLLCKGLKRRTVVFAKFLSAGALWTVAIAVSVLVCFVYTAFFFADAPTAGLGFAFLMPWLFGLFMIALLIFGGTLFGNFGGSLGFGLGTFFLLLLLDMLPHVDRFNPIGLATAALGILSGAAGGADFAWTIAVCVISILGLLLGTVFVFDRKKI